MRARSGTSGLRAAPAAETGLITGRVLAAGCDAERLLGRAPYCSLVLRTGKA